jgi:NitT/TauT family transport system permease protein
VTRRPNGFRPEWWAAVAIVIACAALWEGLARGGALSALLFPPPSTIVVTGWRQVGDGRLPTHVAVSLSRVAAGLLIGGLPGAVVGLLIGWSRRLRNVVDPLLAATHPIPKIAVLPLLMVLFGIGETSKVLVIALSAFFPLAISSMAGVRQINAVHFEVAQNYGASRWQVLRRVVLPGALPQLLAGLRIAVNVALIVTVAVEMAAADRGIGRMIWFAWETMRTEELYLNIFVTSVLGISFSLIIKWLTDRLASWQVEREI